MRMKMRHKHRGEHYCDTCRAITIHMVKKLNIVCINWHAHENTNWCYIDGKMIGIQSEHYGGRKAYDNDKCYIHKKENKICENNYCVKKKWKVTATGYRKFCEKHYKKFKIQGKVERQKVNNLLISDIGYRGNTVARFLKNERNNS